MKRSTVTGRRTSRSEDSVSLGEPALPAAGQYCRPLRIGAVDTWWRQIPGADIKPCGTLLPLISLTTSVCPLLAFSIRYLAFDDSLTTSNRYLLPQIVHVLSTMVSSFHTSVPLSSTFADRRRTPWRSGGKFESLE
ncbi:hypothetical protein BV25DRAFT_190600 [Artomyces pyxidatus]|uniref:Uncharacterized protein n=1 Tax=Artomyces pyxidatus TaxID=48021 RepID=A0ACB8T8M0_9AGAM|nr:hypothetical protein BV25DRAFT_190600 [Artomyces pyxidatus]